MLGYSLVHVENYQIKIKIVLIKDLSEESGQEFSRSTTRI